MATTRVPLLPAAPVFADIRNGSAVRSRTWADAGVSTAYALGRGGQLVPWFTPNVEIISGASVTFYFRIKPRYQTCRRLISVWAKGTSGSGTIRVSAPVSGYTAPDITFGRDHQLITPAHVIEPVVTQSNSEAEYRITIQSVSGDVFVQGLAVSELPRHTLDLDTNEDGVDLTTLQAGEEIYDANFKSVIGVVDSSAEAFDVARRHLVQWAVPNTAAYAAAFTSSSFTSIWPLSLPILGRKLYRTSTTATCNTRILAWVSAGGTTGSAQALVTSSGGTSIVSSGTITATTPTWYPSTAGSSASFTVDAEDLGAADGRRSSAWDDVNVQVRRDAGAGTVYVASVSIWEDAPP